MRQACQRMQQVGSTDNTDEFFALDDRQPLDRRFSMSCTTSSSAVSSVTV